MVIGAAIYWSPIGWPPRAGALCGTLGCERSVTDSLQICSFVIFFYTIITVFFHRDVWILLGLVIENLKPKSNFHFRVKIVWKIYLHLGCRIQTKLVFSG